MISINLTTRYMHTTFLSKLNGVPLRALGNNLLDLEISLQLGAALQNQANEQQPTKSLGLQQVWEVGCRGTHLLLQSCNNKPLEIGKPTPLLPDSHLFRMPCLTKLLLDIGSSPLFGDGGGSRAAREFREDDGEQVDLGQLDDLTRCSIFRTVDQGLSQRSQFQFILQSEPVGGGERNYGFFTNDFD
jgi:hypothetical protein